MNNIIESFEILVRQMRLQQLQLNCSFLLDVHYQPSTQLGTKLASPLHQVSIAGGVRRRQSGLSLKAQLEISMN